MTVSHHMLRRRARAKAEKLNATVFPGRVMYVFRVEKASRGPWRWRVVRGLRR